MKKVIYSLMLLIILLSAMATTSFALAQTMENQEMMQEVQRAEEKINASQLLTSLKNETTQNGVGTVKDVTFKIEDSGAIMTYAEISVNIPLTDNLKSE